MGQPVLSAKNRVEKEVLETIINGLNSGELDTSKAQEIAKETLATLKNIDEHEESLEKFYKDLSQKHTMFAVLYDRVRGEIVKSRELSAHRQALSAIDQGKFQDAHMIAANAISLTANEAINNH